MTPTEGRQMTTELREANDASTSEQKSRIVKEIKHFKHECNLFILLPSYKKRNI